MAERSTGRVSRCSSSVIVGVLLVCMARTSLAADLGCSNVKYSFNAKGINDVTVPRQPLPGHHLRICQQGETCCTEEMEDNLNEQSKEEFERVFRQQIEGMRHTFAVRTQKFDEHFRELLKKSKKDFHSMFLRTYGTMYEQNSYVFTDLFDNLERYYVTGNVNLGDVLENFFLNLYQKMFQVLNAQYSFDQKFWNCMQEFMDDLQPFGDVPQKLSTQVRRSFVAVRTFVQGLSAGRDVIKGMMNVPPTAECYRALMKMTYCPHCQGLPDLKPCNNYCLNVMKGCLAYHAELDQEWNLYIDALINLADRLEGPFNIESVVEPFNIKVSDAIMNFQENGVQVSEKIFENCDKPPLGKRDVSRELHQESIKFSRHDTSGYSSSLDKLVKDIRSKVKVFKRFWANLPYQMCNNERIASADMKGENDCWNGLAKAKYESRIIGDGVNNQKDNPEVNLDLSRTNSLLDQQVLKLKEMTIKLKEAFNGQDVEWQDTDDMYGGSGSGSGENEGSGVGGIDDRSGKDSMSPHFPAVPPTTTAKPIDRHIPPTPTVAAASRMSLQRAVSIFIIPVVLTWLGTMF